jgi:hypothetical protein
MKKTIRSALKKNLKLTIKTGSISCYSLKLFPALLIILLSTVHTHGQSLYKSTIFFEKNKYSLSKHENRKLDVLLDSLKKLEIASIKLEGNADHTGDSLYNLKLSGYRLKTVKNYLSNHGVPENLFTTMAFGFSNPVADNNTEQGRQKNRRVDILVVIKLKIPEIKTSLRDSGKLTSILELYKKLETPPQKFCIDNNRDTIIRCKKGTLVFIKAKSFNLPARCSNHCVTIHIKEEFSKSDMILDRVSTMSNGSLLESQSMVYTEALDCNGDSLGLAPGKQLVIMSPTDSIIPGLKVFNGERAGADSNLNWLPTDQVVGNFDVKTVNACAGWFGCGGVRPRRVHFIFGRILRFPIWIAGAFSNSIAEQNKQFRIYQRYLRLQEKYVRVWKRAARRGRKSPTPPQPPQPQVSRQPVNDSLLPRCQQLEKLYKQYGVQDMEALLLAINKPLMDKYHAKSMEDLRVKMKSAKLKDIEVNYNNKKIAFNDLQYYVYTTRTLGWSNLDVYKKINPLTAVNLKVLLNPDINTDCKIVFKKTRSIIPGNPEKNYYSFSKVPRGEMVWIVALKYEEGKPLLAMKEISLHSGSEELEFEVLSLDELKSRLLILDSL